MADTPKNSEELHLENLHLQEAHNLIHHEINVFFEELSLFSDNLEENLFNILDGNESRCLDNEEDKTTIVNAITFMINNHSLFKFTNNSTIETQEMGSDLDENFPKES